MENKAIVFIDSEVKKENHKITDLGAVNEAGEQFHSTNLFAFTQFLQGNTYICGHNLVHHDLKYLEKSADLSSYIPIDTLYLSPLLFPEKPYHKLLKDDKLQTEELNNPLNDAIKAKDLFYDEINAFQSLPNYLKHIFCALLFDFPEFRGFFQYNGFRPYPLSDYHIKTAFKGKICENADIENLIKERPVELAYALSLINVGDKESLTPPWVLYRYPEIENVNKILRQDPCGRCAYCKEKRDARTQLQRIFGFDDFRTYGGEPLQRRAAEAAIEGKSLLAVFPTGGGKSVTFQLPALMEGEAVHGLTVVLSPLQSLMKDQVDNLEDRGISEAVTINGLLSPVERKEAIERVRNGKASILYISPEQLRSMTIEKLLMSRNVVRFVIDEAHCFSAWGQDFRVDYLYIGDFIKLLQEKKGNKAKIPVSCFTATAKQKVISDIRDYFKNKLDIDLEMFATASARENLRYRVLFKETEEEKYNALRALIASHKCPTIVYVSRTRKSQELADKLREDGFSCLAFHGKMETAEKIANQEAFLRDEVQCIVATSAFGMGVDKKDVKLVIHYDISDSLENYVQESGRAGRDPKLDAECYVLYSDNDLDKHFILLNQTKLSINEIQQVWKAIKDLTRIHKTVCSSSLEIARQAGWDDTVNDIETRVKTAVAALESAGYIKRGRNVPHIYATGIQVKNMAEASDVIENSDIFTDAQKLEAKRIIKYLISSRSIAGASGDDAESRVDYIADNLGIEKEAVIHIVNLMQEIGLLADTQDMSAFIRKADSQNKSLQVFERFVKLERYLINKFGTEGGSYSLKELNDEALKEGITGTTVKNIRTIIYYWTIKGIIQKGKYFSQNRTDIVPAYDSDIFQQKIDKRIELGRFIVKELYRLSEKTVSQSDNVLVQFSLVGLLQEYRNMPHLEMFEEPIKLSDVEDALLYLSKVGAVSLQGGFLVSYNGMEIQRLNLDNKIRYKAEDYRQLNDFYKQKIQQIHIVGEYANLMVRNYTAALEFVNDYFQLDYKRFIAKYFKGQRASEIERNITPAKYHKLFDCLSEKQTEIINDDSSKYIVVAAGPGSGKTRVLVHKLASLLTLEDVKHEQLLMVTFSRAAATEFKKRLLDLTGNAANFVEIKTFHSYCFDLLGKIGSLDGVEDVVHDAAKMIQDGDVELGRITKAVVVIDEAQDMDENEFALIRALMARNEDMRVIAVGDDDQNIYQFRGSDSGYMRRLIEDYGAVKYEMTENYRSKADLVRFSNTFLKKMQGRMKQTPLCAAQKVRGNVQLFRYQCACLETPLVNQLLQQRGKGKICVLTNTNEEALRVVGLLHKHKRRAQLIRSMDGFRLTNLAEVRFFLEQIDQELSSPVISRENWKNAIKSLEEIFAGSACLSQCLRMLKEFESVNNKIKYRTDLEEFIAESNYEDFYDDEREGIVVSTIHKAKGREFDYVYLLLNNQFLKTEEEKRKIYVAITRAKSELYIHCNTNIFDDIQGDFLNTVKDEKTYSEPEEIALQLSHRDVFLDYFKDKQKWIGLIKSGDSLNLEGGYFSVVRNGEKINVGKISQAFSEKLRLFLDKGYQIKSARVQFCVYWKGKTDETETLIFLPEIYLEKSKTLNRVGFGD